MEQAIAFLLFKEVSIANNGVQLDSTVVNAATYKFNQFCGSGVGTSSCINGFWNYYQPMHNLWNSSLLQGSTGDGIVGFFNNPGTGVYLDAANQVINRPELGGQGNNVGSGWATVYDLINPQTFGDLAAAQIGSAANQVFYQYPYYDGPERGNALFVVLSPDQQNHFCGGQNCTVAP